MIRQFSWRVAPLVIALCFVWHRGSPTAVAAKPNAVAEDDSDAIQSAVGWIHANDDASIPARYTLSDRQGTIRYYLKATHGAPLSRYADQKVRIRGKVFALPGESVGLLAVEEIGEYDAVLSSQLRDNRRVFPSNTPAIRRVSAVERTSGRSERELDAVAASDAPSVLVRRRTDENLTPEPIPEENSKTPTWDLDGSDTGDCGGCDQPSCPTCCQPCGWPGRFWARGEYLFWWTQGMHLPPLVTTGPSSDQPGFLGSPGTQILFGNSAVNGYGRSGARVTLGTWLNPCQTVGIEGDWFALANASTNYSATSGGNPILSRPYFDTNPDNPGASVEQVALPGSIDGTVSVNTVTTFQSAGLRMLFNLCCCNGCYDGFCLPGRNGPGGTRVDLLVGYRYTQLTDSIGIDEHLNSLNTDAPGTFFVNDTFATRNVFNGVEFGTSMLHYRGRWSISLLSKIALGITTQNVNISGSTTTDQRGEITTFEGGLLAQTSNIGHYRRNAFGVIPELGLNVGYQISPRLRAIVGYTFIYWSQVARAGDQIDLDVNSSLIPPPAPNGDTRHPLFVFRETDFWAQGISVGLDYRF